MFFARESKNKDPAIVISPARGLVDYMYIRQLRNAVRFKMTGDTRKIGLSRQLRFFLNTPESIELYVARVEGRRAGYLLLRREGGTTLITEAVDVAFRRRGVGSELIRHAKGCRPDITAHVLFDNLASRKLHEEAGFVPVGTEGGLVVYRFTR